MYTYVRCMTAQTSWQQIVWQPIVFGVPFNLTLQTQSHSSLFNGTWQKRPREQDSRLRFENGERRLWMQLALQRLVRRSCHDKLLRVCAAYFGQCHAWVCHDTSKTYSRVWCAVLCTQIVSWHTTACLYSQLRTMTRRGLSWHMHHTLSRVMYSKMYTDCVAE